MCGSSKTTPLLPTKQATIAGSSVSVIAKESMNNASYYWSIENSNLFQLIAGASAILTVLGVWILSFGTPVFLYYAFRSQQYLASFIAIALITISYVPWKKGLISNLVNKFIAMTPYFFKKYTILFIGKSLPEEDNDEDGKTNPKPKIYGLHPHGAFCLGVIGLFASPPMTAKVRFVFAPALYASPFFRLLARLVGRPGPADKASIIKYMKRGEDILIPPGGFEEATLSSTKHDRVYIKKRVGFIKLALIHGYDVVPVYVFGENRTYFNVQGNWKMRLKMNSMNIPAIFVWGLSFLPLLPKRDKDGMYIVAGDLLELPKIENPTREEVKLWHDKYIAALVKVFEDHKCDAYGQEEGQNSKMELW